MDARKRVNRVMRLRAAFAREVLAQMPKSWRSLSFVRFVRGLAFEQVRN